MKNFKWLTLILAMLLLALAACSSNEESKKDTNTSTTGEESATTDNANSTYPLTVKSTVEGYADVTFEKMPEKIVVMDYGFLDTLDTLGVEVTGVSKGVFPEHLAKYADDKYLNAGTLKEPLLEDIAAMEPDAIFISGRQMDFYDQLSEIAPTVFVGVDTTNYWNSFIDSVNIAAEIFGKQEEAKAKLAEVETAIEDVKAVAEQNGTALVALYNETLSAYGPGPGSRFGYVHSVFGFKPADETLEDSTHGAQVTYEQVLKINPDILFVVDRLAATGEKSNVKQAIENDIINKTAAAKNGKIVYLNGSLWYLVTGGLQSELLKVQEIKDALK